MDTLIVYCALVFLAALFSIFVKLAFVVARRVQNWLHREERALEEARYEDRFARLAAEASQGPILLTDLRAA